MPFEDGKYVYSSVYKSLEHPVSLEFELCLKRMTVVGSDTS